MGIVLTAAVVPPQTEEGPFERSYVYKGFRVRVAERSGEARSIGSYAITLTPPDGKPTITKSRRDSTIRDLDVVIVTQSVGSGSRTR
jgi:hypothetical protein